MAKEKPESELKRLRTEQDMTRQDEVFGGLSAAEQAAYNGKSERIHELDQIRRRKMANFEQIPRCNALGAEFTDSIL